MNRVKTVTGVLLLFTVLKEIHGTGCSRNETQANTVVNMCESEIWILGRVFLNITTASMGNSTRCRRTLRARTPELGTTTTFNLRGVESNVSRCDQSLIHITSTQNTSINCSTPDHSAFYTGATSVEVTVVLSRTDTAVEVSYCLLVQPDRWQANDTELNCQNATTPRPPPVSSNTPLTGPAASSTFTSTSSTESNMTADSPTSTESQKTAGAVAGGVVGGVVLIIIIAVVIVVCMRRKNREKLAEVGRPGVEDHAYYNSRPEEDLPDPHYSTADDVAPATNRMPSKMPSTTVASSSSQPRLLDGMLASSSSPYELVDETPQDEGTVTMNPVAGSASVTPATKDIHPPKPAGDEYAVVKKPKGKKPPKTPPAKPLKPKDLSASSKTTEATAATTASGDLYAVVDKSRSKGGNAKKSKSDPPSVSASQTAAPSSPGMMYTDVEEVRSAARLPARTLTETEYTTIDHVATANLASDA